MFDSQMDLEIYKQSNDLWVRLLTAKHMRHGDFFRTAGKGSQFWS
jgi:hypothetical protein